MHRVERHQAHAALPATPGRRAQRAIPAPRARLGPPGGALGYLYRHAAENPGQKQTIAQDSQTPTAIRFPIVVENAGGNWLIEPSHPERITCLVPGAYEISYTVCVTIGGTAQPIPTWVWFERAGVALSGTLTAVFTPGGSLTTTAVASFALNDQLRVLATYRGSATVTTCGDVAPTHANITATSLSVMQLA